VLIGQEPLGDPVPGGPWQTARALTARYEFADPGILRAVYRADSALLNRDRVAPGWLYPGP
jgi:hypothetical protein